MFQCGAAHPEALVGIELAGVKVLSIHGAARRRARRALVVVQHLIDVLQLVLRDVDAPVLVVLPGLA